MALDEMEVLIERQLQVFEKLVLGQVTPQEASRVHGECEARRRQLRALLDGYALPEEHFASLASVR
jgi:hypothetical protein